MHLLLPETCRTAFRATMLDLTFHSDVRSAHLWRLLSRLWRRIPRITIHLSQHLSVPSLVLWSSPDGSTPPHSCRCSNVVIVLSQAFAQPQALVPSVVQLGMSAAFLGFQKCTTSKPPWLRRLHPTENPDSSILPSRAEGHLPSPRRCRPYTSWLHLCAGQCSVCARHPLLCLSRSDRTMT